MKSLLRFAFWATVMFALAWAIAGPWQHVIAAIAGRIAVGPGREVEWEDLELFFPYDLGVFVALCFASAWVGWKAAITATTEPVAGGWTCSALSPTSASSFMRCTPVTFFPWMTSPV